MSLFGGGGGGGFGVVGMEGITREDGEFIDDAVGLELLDDDETSVGSRVDVIDVIDTRARDFSLCHGRLGASHSG